MTDNEKGRALLKEAFLEFSEDYLKENKVEEDEVFVLSPQAERRMRKLLREKKYSARERFLEMGKRVAALALTALVSIFVIASYLNKDVSEAVGYDTIGDFSVAHNVSGDGGEIVVTVTPNFSDLDAMEVRTLCVVEYASGECTITEREGHVTVDGQNVSTELAVAQETEAAIVAVFSEYHFYKNGEYVDAVVVDLMQGKDFT